MLISNHAVALGSSEPPSLSVEHREHQIQRESVKTLQNQEPLGLHTLINQSSWSRQRTTCNNLARQLALVYLVWHCLWSSCPLLLGWILHHLPPDLVQLIFKYPKATRLPWPRVTEGVYFTIVAFKVLNQTTCVLSHTKTVNSAALGWPVAELSNVTVPSSLTIHPASLPKGLCFPAAFLVLLAH